jgi:hypothetical protein
MAKPKPAQGAPGLRARILGRSLAASAPPAAHAALAGARDRHPDLIHVIGPFAVVGHRFPPSDEDPSRAELDAAREAVRAFPAPEAAAPYLNAFAVVNVETDLPILPPVGG